MFLCLKLWDIADTKSLGMQDALQLFVIELLISLWRNNGIYIIVVVSVGALIVSKKVFARHLVGCILTICIVMLIKGPFYNAMGVYDDATRESIAIPVQQMAAVINSGYELSENEEAVLYSLAPKEIWIDNYCPTLVDDLKFKMDEGYLKTHLGDVLSVWLKLLIPNFDIYVRAYLMETIGFWKLDTFQGNYWDYWYGVEDNYDYGLHERDLIGESTGISVRTLLTKCMRFISSGTMVWVLLFCVCAILYQGHNYERLLPLFPLLGIWGTVMVAAPIAFAYRYVVALPMALPVIIGVTFAGKSTEICI